MTKHLVLISLLLLAGCTTNPYASTGTQSASCGSSTSTTSTAATLQLAIINAPSGATSSAFAGTLTDPDGTAVTLTSSATSTGGLLNGTISPGVSYHANLTYNGTAFFSGSLTFSAGACSYSATVDYSAGTVTNGG